MVEEYEKIHKKEITDEKVMEAVTENSDKKLKLAKSKSGIIVKGLTDVSVRFSKCCSPVPGDEIVGYVTRGRGVSIHRTDCVNIMCLQESERARLIDAEWQDMGLCFFGREVRDGDQDLRQQPHRASGRYFQNLHRAEY